MSHLVNPWRLKASPSAIENYPTYVWPLHSLLNVSEAPKAPLAGDVRLDFKSHIGLQVLRPLWILDFGCLVEFG